ncbi:MAG: hypothetical protein ISS48_02470 [Candidatus Aenigmarchaeota archaeon]|nr:hypothetical protein [Candidatus Aenigmarchaeota archaeon]
MLKMHIGIGTIYYGRCRPDNHNGSREEVFYGGTITSEMLETYIRRRGIKLE